jgi:hypothetical protein
VKRFLFLNDERQLLAFCIHPKGTNLPYSPLGQWRLVDDHGHLDVIYDWEPDKLKAMAEGLKSVGFFVFSPKRSFQRHPLAYTVAEYLRS